MPDDGPTLSPAEVTLALKIAYLRGSWEAVSAIIHSLEHEYGEVSLRQIALTERGSMEAEHDETPPVVLAYWLARGEA